MSTGESPRAYRGGRGDPPAIEGSPAAAREGKGQELAQMFRLFLRRSYLSSPPQDI